MDGVTDMEVELTPGRIYLAKEKKARVPFDLFSKCEECGRPSLLVTRCHPRILKEEHGIEGDKILWLSMTSGTRNLDPTGLGRISEIMAQHIRESDEAVVLLDGLEYLASMNEFRKVMGMMDRMYEEATVNKGIFVTTIDPDAFGSREVAFLERNAICLVEGCFPRFSFSENHK
jgi:hypothetical protein